MAWTAEELIRAPLTAVKVANVLLTQDEVEIGITPRDVVWTHRQTTLYRYRSEQRRHATPVLLVFALINRPDIFDLRPGRSFVEFLLAEGFDVFLVDWGYPGEEDADMGIEEYVCDELHWAVRETRRASGSWQVSLIGWCIGAALCTMYAALEGRHVKNMVLLTAPVDVSDSLYTRWVGGDQFDVDAVADAWPVVPGRAIDTANKLMKPVTNYFSTYRRLWEQASADKLDAESHQAMAAWIADNPDFPSKAFRQWITWMYKENRLVSNAIELRGRQVDLGVVDQALLVVTADADHITPRCNTTPLLDLVASDDVTHFDRHGGHIGLMAGSKAKREVWPDIAAWLAPRSQS